MAVKHQISDAGRLHKEAVATAGEKNRNLLSHAAYYSVSAVGVFDLIPLKYCVIFSCHLNDFLSLLKKGGGVEHPPPNSPEL